ncbi:MAG: flagellar basal body rod protein FlgB [Deltaproteobacteria bacterium]|nr:MAG: flagellar basal body rod protein FlgB [Deltaproteobacteria bacterium]
MKIIGPFDKSINLLGKSLDLRAKNQQVISSNIANAETPGYAPARFNFEQDLQDVIERKNALQLKTTSRHHLPIVPENLDQINGTITKQPDQTGIGDQNGVNIDEEMIALAKNQLMYEASAKLLRKKFAMLKYAVSEGK